MSGTFTKKRKRGALGPSEAILRRRNKAEEELQRSKQEMEKLSSELAMTNSLLGATLESIAEGILVIDFDGKVAFHNSVFQSMWGLDWKFLFNDVRGRDLVSELAERTTTPELFRILVEDAFSNAPLYSPAKFLLRDGRTFRVYFVIRPLRPGLLGHASGPGRSVASAGSATSLLGRASGLVLRFSDITDELRAQNQLRQASLFFEANQGMALADANNTILRVNKAFTQITGYEAKEVVGKSYHMLRSDFYGESFYQKGKIQLDETGAWEGELVSRRKNGETYVQWCHVRALKDDSGTATFYLMSFSDMTQVKKAEADEKLSHEAVAAVSQGVIITDGEGRAIRVNQAFLRITGYEETEVLGRNCRFLQGPGSSLETVSNIREAIREAKVFSGEILNYRKDGSEFWNDLSITPILGVDGKPAHFIGILRDVSDRKRLDELLHRRQYEHLHLINSLPGPVARINQNLEYEFLNDKYVSVFGRSRYDAIGHPIEEIAGEIAFVLQKPLFQEALQGKVVEYETRFLDSAGLQKVWLVTLIPDVDVRNVISGFFKIYSDITEQKRAEEWLSKLNDTLEHKVAERTKSLEEAQEKLLSQERTVVLGHLAGSVAHELRNPLAVISNSVFFLKKIQPEADPRIRDYLEVILNETRTSNKIISDLLNFGSVHETEKSEVSVKEIVEAALERSILPPGVRVTVELGEDLPLFFADRQHVLQVMTNLLINAKEAMNESGSIEISAQSCEGYVTVHIRDDGPGIPKENLSKIFQPLYTTKAKGIGLGLAVSRKLMNLNGGDLTVRSEVGVGTEFTMLLPVKKSPRVESLGGLPK